MPGYDILIESILAEARQTAKGIEKEAQEQAEGIIAEAKKTAAARSAAIVEAAKKAADEALQRHTAVYALELKRERLRVKREMLDLAFDKALSAMGAFTRKQYLEVVKRKLEEIELIGDETVLVSDSEKYIDETFLSLVSSSLKLMKSNEIENGFILNRGGMYIDATFKTIMADLKVRIETEIAGILFKEAEDG